MVETALIFLVFASMLIGAFDFGQFLFLHQALAERVRTAARWGLINDPMDSASIKNMVVYGQATAGTSGYFGLTTGNVDATTQGSGTDDYRLTVSIHDFAFDTLSPYLSGRYTGQSITVSIPIGLTN